MTIAVTYQDKIAVLNLGDDENRFSLGFLDDINGAIDDLVDNGAQGLVTTGAGKFYSNGLDLDWLMAHGDQMQAYVGRVHALFARVLTLPIPTAAAVNGHAFGAGAMLAMAHDYRTMRSDRGFFCFPEVDIRIPFTPGMAALIQAKLTPQAAIASMTTGRRFGGGLLRCQFLGPVEHGQAAHGGRQGRAVEHGAGGVLGPARHGGRVEHDVGVAVAHRAEPQAGYAA